MVGSDQSERAYTNEDAQVALRDRRTASRRQSAAPPIGVQDGGFRTGGPEPGFRTD